jgi:hypothetical protein
MMHFGTLGTRLGQVSEFQEARAALQTPSASMTTPATARNTQKGKGNLTAIIFTLILASLGFVALKVVPCLFNEYQFQDGIQDIARYASAMHQDPGKVREAVLKEAEKDDVPITTKDVKIEGTGGNFRISAEYSVTVDLKVYQWILDFHPSVSNNSLT